MSGAMERKWRRKDLLVFLSVDFFSKAINSTLLLRTWTFTPQTWNLKPPAQPEHLNLEKKNKQQKRKKKKKTVPRRTTKRFIDLNA